MDHIEPPYWTSHSLRVPYVCNSRFTFDEDDFLSYPVRCGMSNHAMDSKDLFPDDWSIDDLAPFLQAWLYFGTLHYIFKSFLESNYKWTHFVKEDSDGQMVITTEYLSSYIFNWAAYESGIPKDLDYGLSRVGLILHLLQVIFDKFALRRNELFVEQEPRIDSVETPGHLVFLSLIILYEVLLGAAREIYSHLNYEFLPGLVKHDLVLMTRLLDHAGWCPSEIQTLYTMPETSCTTTYFLTMVNRKALNKDHSTCLSSGKCRAYDVDYNTYETKHIHPGCDCQFLPQGESTVSLCVSWILDDGSLPLLSFHEAEDDSQAMLNVTYCPLTPKDEILPYVAISHVWSDGLGNQEKNSLPLCILRKIQEQVDKLFEPAHRPNYFWIDTICVPKANKLPALELMLRTYAEAALVLVFDASLETLSVKARPQERLLRITVSPWMQRLWTLQEGRVAKSLAFQFADRACLARDIVHDCVRTSNRMKLPPPLPAEEGDDASWNEFFSNTINRALAVDFRSNGLGAFELEPPEFHAAVKHIRHILEDNEPDFPTEGDQRLALFMHKSHSLDLTFAHVNSRFFSLQSTPDKHLSYTDEVAETFSLLPYRTTSRKEDEFYCLANLTRVPVLPVLLARPEARMQRLLSLMSAVPASIIFWDSIPRLKGDCFAWAPISLMQDNSIGDKKYMDSLGYIKNSELHVSLPGWKIQNPPESQTHGIVVSEPSNSGVSTNAFSSGPESALMELLSSDTQDQWKYWLICAGHEHSQIQLKDFEGATLRVIMQEKFTTSTADSPDHFSDVIGLDGLVLRGALVSELENGERTSLVKYHFPVLVKRQEWMNEKPSTAYHRFEWLDDDYLWRIV